MTQTFLQNTFTDVEDRRVVAKGEGGRGREGWTGSLGRAGANYIEKGWRNNKILLYGTGNYIQYPAINHNRKEYEKNVCICVYIHTHTV